MIKIAAILFFVISSTCALCDLTRHIIHQEVFMKRSIESQPCSSCHSIITNCSARDSQIQQQHDLFTREGLAEYLSDVAVLSCGSCFDEYENYFICIGEDKLAEQFREAECIRSDGKFCSERLFDGIANGDIRSYDDEEDVCIATCQDLHNLRDVLGCCAASFVEYGIFVNTTQEYDNCNAKLSQPCSDGGSGADITDESGSDGGPTIEEPTDEGPTDDDPTDDGPTDEIPTDNGATDDGPTDGGPTDGGPTDGRFGEPDSGLSATPAFLVIALLTLITSIFFGKQCI